MTVVCLCSGRLLGSPSSRGQLLRRVERDRGVPDRKDGGSEATGDDHGLGTAGDALADDDYVDGQGAASDADCGTDLAVSGRERDAEREPRST